MKKLTKETLIIILAVGVGFLPIVLGKLGTGIAVGLLAFYAMKKGAIDKGIDWIMKSIPGAVGIPPVDPDPDEDDKE